MDTQISSFTLQYYRKLQQTRRDLLQEIVGFTRMPSRWLILWIRCECTSHAMKSDGNWWNGVVEFQWRACLDQTELQINYAHDIQARTLSSWDDESIKISTSVEAMTPQSWADWNAKQCDCAGCVQCGWLALKSSILEFFNLIDTSVWGWNMVQKWCSVSHTGNVMDKWLWKEWRIQDLPNFWRWGVCWNSFDSHNRVQHYFQKLYLSAGSHGVPSPTHVN